MLTWFWYRLLDSFRVHAAFHVNQCPDDLRVTTSSGSNVHFWTNLLRLLFSLFDGCYLSETAVNTQILVKRRSVQPRRWPNPYQVAVYWSILLVTQCHSRLNAPSPLPAPTASWPTNSVPTQSTCDPSTYNLPHFHMVYHFTPFYSMCMSLPTSLCTVVTRGHGPGSTRIIAGRLPNKCNVWKWRH